jgi:arsenate reductase
MDFVLYHYAGCSTCRKARRYLEQRGVSPTLIDLKLTPPSTGTVAELHAVSDLPVKKFFNTSGQSYRGGGWKDQLPRMSDAEAHEALSADGMLIKRPILSMTRKDGTRAVTVGFKEAVWSALLETGASE